MKIISQAMYWDDFDIIGKVIVLYRDDMEVGYTTIHDLNRIDNGIFQVDADRIFDDMSDAKKA